MPVKQNSIQVIFKDLYVIADNVKNYTLVLSKASQYLSDIVDIASQPKGCNGFRLNLSYQGYNADVSVIPKQEVELYHMLTLLYHEYEKAPITTFFRAPVSSDALSLAVAGQEQITVRNYKSVLLLILTAAATNNILTKEENEDINKVDLRIQSLERAIHFIHVITTTSAEDKELVVQNDSNKNSLYSTIQKLKVKLEANLTEYKIKRKELEQEQYTAKIVKSLNNITSTMKNLEIFYTDALKIRQINSDEIVSNGTYMDSKSQVDYYWSVVNSCASKLKNKDALNNFFINQYPELYFATPDEKVILYMLNNVKNNRVASTLDKKELEVLGRVNSILSDHLGLKNNHQKAIFIAMLSFKFDLTDEQFMAITNTKMFFPEAIIDTLKKHNEQSQFSNDAYNSTIKDSMMLFYRLFVTRYRKLQTISGLTEKLLHSIGALGVIKLRTSINDVFLRKLGEFLFQINQVSESIVRQLSTDCQSFNSTQDKIRVALFKKLFGNLYIQVNGLLRNINELNIIYNTDKIVTKVQEEALYNLNNFMDAVTELLERDGDFTVNQDLKDKIQKERECLSSEIQGDRTAPDSETTVTFSCKGFRMVSTK